MVRWLPWAWVRRVLVLVALAVAGVVLGRLVVLVLDGRTSSATGTAPSGAQVLEPPPAPPATPSATPPATALPTPRTPSGGVVRAAAALRAWDAARATAYARGDPAALRRLYLPRSRAGLRDVRLLRGYVERGLVVRDLRTQVLALRVLAAGPARLRLEVTDRRAGGRAVGRDVRADLPHDAPSTRVVVLRSGAGNGTWRVASVRAVGKSPPG